MRQTALKHLRYTPELSSVSPLGDGVPLLPSIGIPIPAPAVSVQSVGPVLLAKTHPGVSPPMTIEVNIKIYYNIVYSLDLFI